MPGYLRMDGVFFFWETGMSTPYLQIHNLCKVSFTLGLKSF